MRRLSRKMVCYISIDCIINNDISGTICWINQPYKISFQDMEELILNIEWHTSFARQRTKAVVRLSNRKLSIKIEKCNQQVSVVFLVQFNKQENHNWGGEVLCIEKGINSKFENTLELLKLITDSMNIFNDPLYSKDYTR